MRCKYGGQSWTQVTVWARLPTSGALGNSEALFCLHKLRLKFKFPSQAKRAIAMINKFNANGVEISYADHKPTAADRGRTILLIHGFASNQSVNWQATQWLKTLTDDGRRVVLFDNRGHGQSQKLYQPTDYTLELMAQDAKALLDHLAIPCADVMGYSMGARIAIIFALLYPQQLNTLILGGIGQNLLKEPSLPNGLVEAMEALDIEAIKHPMLKIFRHFAQSTHSDLRAMAACARGFQKKMDTAQFMKINQPVLICTGTKDDVAGDPAPLEPLFQKAHIVAIPDRDHNRAVGDRLYRQKVLDFLALQP